MGRYPTHGGYLWPSPLLLGLFSVSIVLARWYYFYYGAIQRVRVQRVNLQ